MSKDNSSLPSQKELEKEISDYLSQKYGGRVKIISTGLFPQVEKDEKSAEPVKVPLHNIFNFDIKPEELVSYLDEYVVRQDDAKAILATKICTHFNRIRHAMESKDSNRTNVGQIKGNILLIGPTGVGKTFLIKLIAQKIGVPFVKGDATKFSETGYVGGDVEDLVRDLVRQADGDIDAAQYGIIYVDEIDKIAASPNRIGHDVSRTGVQRALLKPMEETEVDLKVAHDPISQIEAMEYYRAKGKREKRVVNTKNILFIVSGAFAGLEEIIDKRTRERGIGFEGQVYSKTREAGILEHVKADDLIQYGFESEFVGRLPVVAVLGELSENDLLEILVNPNSAVIVGKKQDFLAYGIKIIFEHKALAVIAARAKHENTGARGLVSIMEKVLLPFEKKLPSTEIRHLVVTSAIVDNPKAELEDLLAHPEQQAFQEQRYEELAESERERIIEFISRTKQVYMAEHDVVLTPRRLALMARYSQEGNRDPHDVCDLFIALVVNILQCAEDYSSDEINVVFSHEAIDRILAITPHTEEAVIETANRILTACNFGLRLLSQKKGAHEVEITAEGVDQPERFINDLVASKFKLD